MNATYTVMVTITVDNSHGDMDAQLARGIVRTCLQREYNTSTFGDHILYKAVVKPMPKVRI